MASNGYNIEYLPEHILKKIFFYAGDAKTLRSVSKYFKEIVNSSEELTRKLELDITKVAHDSPVFIDSVYQKIIIEDLKADHLNILHNYKWKRYINQITFRMEKKEFLRSFMLLRTILYDFINIQHIEISLSRDGFFGGNLERFGIVIPEFPALKTLMIKSDIADVTYLFTNSPNLKKVCSHFTDITKYSNEVSWILEELELHTVGIAPETFMQFLEKQSNTLKRLSLRYQIPLNFIARRLHNLEALHINSNFGDFDNEGLISNDKLKELSFRGVTINSQSLENILTHYKYIEKLKFTYCRGTTKINRKLALPNLKDLTFSETNPEILSQLTVKNLKSLNTDFEIDLNFVKNLDCRKNIEKLETRITDYTKISSILEYFPSLKKMIFRYILDVTESMLSNLVSIAKKFKIHFIVFCRKLEEKLIELLSGWSNDEIIIKYHEYYYFNYVVITFFL